MIPETDRAYIAGLFDGEGCVTYKQYMRKRPHNKKAYPTWSIRMEIAMTDKSLLTWCMKCWVLEQSERKDTKPNTPSVGKNSGVGVVNLEMHTLYLV